MDNQPEPQSDTVEKALTKTEQEACSLPLEERLRHLEAITRIRTARKNTTKTEELSASKLEAEIGELRKPVYKRATFYSAIAPAVVAGLTIIFTWSSGWFDVQQTKLKNDGALLEARNEKLKTEQFKLDYEIEQQKQERREESIKLSTLENQIRQAEGERATLTNSLARLESDRKQLIAAQSELAGQLAKSAASSSNQIKLIAQLQRERTSAEAERDNALAAKANLEHILKLKDLVAWMDSSMDAAGVKRFSPARERAELKNRLVHESIDSLQINLPASAVTTNQSSP